MKSKGLGYIFKSVKSSKISTITIISIVISILFFSTIINAGDIQVDKSAPASNRPQMDKASNEVPVVNIVAPSAGGVSHNKFKEYNVKKQGVILNNSLEVGRSELGGMLYGNPNFQHNKIAADIVLNEVTGVTQTSLAGYTEMFGKPAEFVLANPNGIIVSGGGFINMPRVTLSTGTPRMDADGDLQGLDIDNGMILINESTLNTTDLNYFELISRTAKIEAEIRAGKELTIKTGRNHYNYKDKSVTPKSDNGAEKPIVAIDSVLLGGMYAGRIYLIATEDGVGVNSENGIGANIEDVTITANGDIVLKKDIEAKRDVTIEAKGDIKQSDKIFAERNIKLKSGKNIEITESSASDDEIELLSGGKTEISSGNKLSNSGNINSVGEISIKSEFISNFGTIKTDKDFRISSFEFDNTNAEIEAIGSITGFDINKIINKNGKITAGQKIEFLNFANFNNKDGSISSGGAINLRTNRNFIIEGDYYAENFFSAQASSITNKTDLNMQGEINLLTKTGSFTNEPDKKIVSAKSVKIETAQGIENFSEITSTKNITLTAQTDIKNLANGKITSGEGSSTIKAGQTFYNESEISSESDIQITSQNIENAGKIETTNAITTESSTLTNKENGTIQANGDISVTARNNIKNNKAVITSGSNIILQGENGANNEQIINKNGTIEAAGDITVKTDNLENIGEDSGGYTIKYVSLGSEGKNNWRTMGENRVISELTTTPAYLISGGNINIYDATTRNYGSLISAGADINFINGTLKNETSAIEIEIKQKIYQGYYYEKCDSVMGIEYNCQDIHKRRWLPGKAIALSANPATIEAAGDVNIQATEITNKNDVGYEPISDEKKSAQINQTPVTVSYNVAKREKINIEGVKIAYENAKNQAFTQIKTDHQGNYLPQNPGYQTLNQFYGSDYFLIRINYKPDRDTKIKIFSDLYAEQRAIRDALFKATAKRFLHPSITTDAQQLRLLMDNAVKANKNLELALGVELTPQQIAALDEDIIWYVEEEINGEKVLIPRIYLSKLTLDSLKNGNSVIKSRGNINLAVKENITNTGEIQSGKNLTITSKNITNRTIGNGKQATIKSGASADIIAQENITNTSGLIQSGDSLTLQTKSGDITNQTIGNGKQATIAADGSTTLTATQNITNTSGSIKSGDSLTLQTQTGDITNQTTVHKTQGSGYIKSHSGQTARISSSGDLKITSGANLINTGADITSAGDAVIAATNDIIINPIKTRNYSAIYFSGGHIISDRIENTGSNLNIYGNLNIEAKNLAIIASNINVQQNAIITTTNNFELASAQDTNYFQSAIKKSGFFSSKKTTITKSSTTNINSSITTGGDLKITAQNQNIQITGSSVTVENNAELTAGQNINITAGYNTNFYDKQTKKSGLFTGGALYSKEQTAKGKGDQTAVNSALQAKNLTINAGQKIDIIGADITAQNAQIQTGDDLAITSAPEQHYAYNYSEKTTFGLGSLLGGNLGDFDFKDGRLSLSLAKGEYNKNNTRTDATTQNPSDINAEQNIALNSDKNIEISGSNINAGNDITLAAQQNINITPTQETTKTNTQTEKGEIELSLGVGNAYVDAGYAVSDAVKAAEAVKKAEQQLSEIKKLRDQGKATDKAVQDAQINLAAATTNLGIATIKTAEAAADAAGAASTSMGTGFYADLKLQTETTETKTQEQITTNLASSITAGKNITITSGANTTQTGSSITSATGDITYKTGQNLAITASQDTYNYASASETKSASLTIGSTNPSALITNDIGGGIGYGTESQTATATTANNSRTTAQSGAINITTGANAQIAGANIKAQQINANIAGDLNVRSLQNQNNAYGNSNNFNLGYNTGSGASIGAGYGKNNADSQWVNSQTTIIGTDNLQINVKNTTDITGAVIANINNNGEDTGNLQITTKRLTYADINDYDTSANTGANLQLDNLKIKTNQNNKKYITGDAQISIKNTGHQTEQTTKATIGSGSIQTGDNSDTTNLNRNTTNTQTTTQDTITAALNAETAFDLRLLSEAGRQEIAQDFKNLPENIAQIGKGLTNNIITQSIKNSITDQNKNLIDNINQYIADDKKITEIQTDTELTQILNGLTNLDALYLQYALQNTADIAGANGEFTGDLQLYALIDSGKGYAYLDTSNAIIGVNTFKTDLTDSADTINVIFHETTNYPDHTQNEQTAINRGDTAQAIWELKNFENKNTNTITTQEWNDQNYNSPVILYGNLLYDTSDPNNILLFKFGKRPLSFLDRIGVLLDNPTSNDLNIGVYHEHGFFEDGTGDNKGFGRYGRFSEKPEDLINYIYEDEPYNDDIMREALDNIIDGEYNFLTNNCQHWADRLREEYKKLEQEKER